MRNILIGMLSMGVSVAMAAPAFQLQLLKGQIPAIPLSIQLPSSESAAHVVQSDLTMSGRFRITTGKAGYQLTGNVPGTVNLMHHGKSLYSQHFSDDSAKSAHQISDAVYQKLVNQPGFFSADLLFVRRIVQSGEYTQYQLVKSNLAGDDASVLVSSRQPIVSAAWAPDGQSVVYASYANDQAVVQQYTLATGQTSILYQHPGFITDLAYSPNGGQLAMTVAATGGSAIVTLDLSDESANVITQTAGINISPTWGPQGQVINFVSNRSGKLQAYSITLADAAVSLVSANALPVSAVLRSGSLLYSVTKQGTFASLQKQTLPNGKPSVLVSTVELSAPAATADGSLLVYNAVFGSKHGLELISSDGKVRLRLLPTMGWLSHASWSPLTSGGSAS